MRNLLSVRLVQGIYSSYSMINVAENSKTSSDKDKIPLWFIITFSAVLLFTLSSFGLYAYQKKTQNKLSLVQESESYIQKLGILEQKDVIDTNWLHTLNPLVKKVQGRLLWSTHKQQGLMEFINLPKLKKYQQFKLWVYDLQSNGTKPVLAKINHLESYQSKNKIIMPFSVTVAVKSPFKFELMLEDKNIEGAQPLLLAQP